MAARRGMFMDVRQPGPPNVPARAAGKRRGAGYLQWVAGDANRKRVIGCEREIPSSV